jgi:Uma2 family endonuclease
MLDIEFPLEPENIDMPSLNHSYICSQVLRQLFANDKIEAFTELTLDIDKGLTPDICVYPAEIISPNFLRDVSKLAQMPILAIEVISASQNIQVLLEKAEHLIQAGIKVVWTIEPYTQTIFITTAQSEERVYNQAVEFDLIKVDFKKIFSINKLSN